MAAYLQRDKEIAAPLRHLIRGCCTHYFRVNYIIYFCTDLTALFNAFITCSMCSDLMSDGLGLLAILCG